LPKAHTRASELAKASLPRALVDPVLDDLDLLGRKGVGLAPHGLRHRGDFTARGLGRPKEELVKKAVLGLARDDRLARLPAPQESGLVVQAQIGRGLLSRILWVRGPVAPDARLRKDGLDISRIGILAATDRPLKGFFPLNEP